MLNKRFQMVWRRPYWRRVYRKDSVALVLGDNIFFDLIWMNCYVLIKILKELFLPITFRIRNDMVVEFDKDFNALSIEENL
jgi:hypothetical protein